MKQFDTITKNFGGNSFFIRPFGAFDASRITGELSATLIPLISGLLPAVSNANDVDDLKDVNIDYDRLGPSLASSFSSLDGEKLEHLLRLLLVDKNNISVRIGGETEVQALTYDIANDIFAGDLQDMFMLAVEVIKVNFNGFSRNSPTDLAQQSQSRKRLRTVWRARPECVQRD